MSGTEQTEALRRALHDHPDDLSDIGSLTQAAIMQGSARRRRRTQTTAVMGASAAAFATFAAVSMLSTDDRPPSPGPAQSPDTTPSSPAAWAQELPAYQGEPVSFVIGNKVYFDTHPVRLEATDAGDAAQTNSGVALLIEDDRTSSGGEFASYYGLVNGNGEVTELPPSTGGENLIVSPDRDLVAYGHSVVDVQTGREVAAVPEGAQRFISWTPAGITFADADGEFSIVQPGKTARPIAGEPGSYPSGTPAGIRSSGDCSEMVRQEQDGSADPYAKFCGQAPLFTVAPAGGVAIDKMLQVVSSDGQRRSFEGAPRFDLPGFVTFVWTDSNQVAFPVQDRQEGLGYVVICNVDSLECARQAGPLTVPDGQDIEIAK